MPSKTIAISKPILGEEEIAAVTDVIHSGWISQGPKVLEFEKNFAEYVGSRHACAVSNCTVSLHLALLTVGVKPGDTVVTVSHSFIATANAARYCGAEPVFLDIDPATYNLSPSALEAYLKTAKRPPKALLLVHQMGMPCDPAILAIAEKYKLPVIEDAACAIGSEVSFDVGKTWEKIGKPRGTIACFSFHPRKVVSTGEGGMLTTNDPKIDQQLRLLRQHGMSLTDLQRHQANKILVESYDVLGYNYRMTDLQAAIGIEQLKKLPTFIAKRRALDQYYRKALASIKWLEVPEEPSYARSNWQSYPVRVVAGAPKSRDELMQALFERGIMTKPGIMNAHEEKVYSSMHVSLPESEKARREVILLPLHGTMTEEDIHFIANVLSSQ